MLLAGNVWTRRMNDLAELWAERQRRKVKPYSRYGNARRHCRDITKDKREERNSNTPLTTKIKELILPDILRKLTEIK